MSKSYFPRNRGGQIDWHQNFAAEFPLVGQELGFTEAEIANAVNDSLYAIYVLQTLGPDTDSPAAHAILEGPASGVYVDLPSASGAPTAVKPGIDTRRQARVERIKAHPKFSDAIAKTLKIASEKLDPKKYQAELGVPRRTGTYIMIPFRKAGGNVSGINLYRQCKNDGEPQKIGFFFRTPAMDTTPMRGKVEDCKYTARAVIDGNEIGQPSDPVSVAAV